MDESEVKEEVSKLLNLSVVTYRFATYWGARDYRCVEISMEVGAFEVLEGLLGKEIKGRLGKKYE